tara:strand:- start:9893 stop:10291 length:399 start_codon:yes stop_codon:yes gene_type:complete
MYYIVLNFKSQLEFLSSEVVFVNSDSVTTYDLLKTMDMLLRTDSVAPEECYPFYRVAHTDDEYSDIEDDNGNFLTSHPAMYPDSDEEEEQHHPGSRHIYVPAWAMRAMILLSAVAFGAVGTLFTHVDSGASL